MRGHLNDTDIAIIGLGGRFPGSRNLLDYDAMLSKGQVAFTPIPAQRWDHRVLHSDRRSAPNKTAAQQAGFVEGFDDFYPEYFGISPRRARIMDPQQRLVLECTRQALDEAGYLRKPLGGGRTGVYMGVSSTDHRGLSSSPTNTLVDWAGRLGGSPSLSSDQMEALTAAIPAVSGYTIIGQQSNMVAANVSEVFDFTGPSFAVDTACSSALVALHQAIGHLRSGEVDGAVVGGAYVLLDPVLMVCFSRIGALSQTDCCRPFSQNADGFMIGEGVGVVVLKRLTDARRDGDPIAAVISGSAVNNDGKGGGPLTPLLSGQRDVLAQAWADAKQDPADVDFVETHGTATPVGDQVELEAMAGHFESALAKSRVRLGAVKANVGHTISAAGMASLIKTVLTLRAGRSYGQPGLPEERPQVEEMGFSMSDQSTDGVPTQLAGVNAFGFGGTNAHVVLRANSEAALRQNSSTSVQWSFSAPTQSDLERYMKSCYETLVTRPGWTSRGVAELLSRRETHQKECSITGMNEAELLEHLAAAVGIEQFEAGFENPGADFELRLPPTPLPEKSYWIVDESKRSPGAPPSEVPSTDSSQKEFKAEDVWSALLNVTGREKSEVTIGQQLKRDLNFDSLMALELQNELSNRLTVEPDLDSLWTDSDPTVGELIDFVSLAAKSEQASAPTPVAKVKGSAIAADWAKWPEIRGLQERRESLIQAGWSEPYFQESQPIESGCAQVGERRLINFSSYDYLDLSRDSRVVEASQAAVARWGASANASRIAAGERPIHAKLEETLAKFLGTQSCLTLVGGYGTNVSAIGHLLGPGDLLLHDQLAHACIVEGGRLSGAKVRAFRHNNVEDLAKELELWRPQVRRVLIAVEGVYSMDGDVVHLPEIIALKERFDALLLVDEAHSLGVIGTTGRGVAEHFGIDRGAVDLWMGTLSKSLVSCGGYLAGDTELIDYLRYTMPGFIYSVGMAPAAAAAALAALEILMSEPERVSSLRECSNELRRRFGAIGIESGLSTLSAVVPWIVGKSDDALRIAQAMNQRGILVHPIISPAVEEGAARLRFFVTTAHQSNHLDEVMDVIQATRESSP